MSSSPATLSSLKPFDRVMAWLDSNIPAGQRRSGVKIPPTREVSRQLNVSTGTVQKVYQHLVEQGLLQTEVGSGTFWTPAAERSTPRAASNRTLKIGLNVGFTANGSNPEGWARRIFGGIFNAILSNKTVLALHPTPLLLDTKGNPTPEADAMLREIDGFISFPCPTLHRVNSLLEQCSIPNITLNPLSVSSTTGFVAPNYFEANRRASAAFVHSGRKRLLLFLSPGTEHSVSCQLRLSGFASGLHLAGQTAEFRTLIAPTGDYEYGYTLFRDFLAKGWIPDAVCTAGDLLAKGVIDAALAHGLSVPEELSVIGGTGIILPRPGDSHYLTSMTQPLEELGEQLVASVLAALRTPGQPVPGVNLPTPFTLGTTTRPEEHAYLT